MRTIWGSIMCDPIFRFPDEHAPLQKLRGYSAFRFGFFPGWQDSPCCRFEEIFLIHARGTHRRRHRPRDTRDRRFFSPLVIFARRQGRGREGERPIRADCHQGRRRGYRKFAQKVRRP